MGCSAISPCQRTAELEALLAVVGSANPAGLVEVMRVSSHPLYVFHTSWRGNLTFSEQAQRLLHSCVLTITHSLTL